ncbi:MAG: hypothetical protein A3D87_02985 [Omnitrophica WOR_2 bacterium RIFCSPHIGHO2_02_FULL_50_17]|nr:MAG: hypothetical protein A3D87_02985 [Omnitrophica WOR_2 bacterium RIFCSPHIGHO2_02_FULL_50_17]
MVLDAVMLKDTEVRCCREGRSRAFSFLQDGVQGALKSSFLKSDVTLGRGLFWGRRKGNNKDKRRGKQCSKNGFNGF